MSMTPEGFSPVSIYDVTKLTYCSYCFKCNTRTDLMHRNEECNGCEEFVRLNPSYWSNGSEENFERIKLLTFVYVKCFVTGCTFETDRPYLIKEHLVQFHNLSLSNSEGEETSVEMPSSSFIPVAITNIKTEQVESSPTSSSLPSVKETSFDNLTSNSQPDNSSSSSSTGPKHKDIIQSIEKIAHLIHVKRKASPLAESEPKHCLKTTDNGTDAVSIISSEATINTIPASSSGQQSHSKLGESSKVNLSNTTSTPLLISESASSSTSKDSYMSSKKKDMTDSTNFIPKHEDVSDCSLNSWEEQKPKKIKRGRKSHSRKAFKCGYCRLYETVHVPNIKAHYLRTHSIDKLYFCEPCFFVSAHRGGHWSHVNKSCKLLNQSDPDFSPSNLQDNEPKQSPDSKFEITVFEEIKDHIKEDNIGEEVMADNISTVEVPGKSQYVGGDEANEDLAHNEYFHSQLETFFIRCIFCGFSTQYTDSMRGHIASKHLLSISVVSVQGGVLVYDCRHCEEKKEKKTLIAAHYITKHMTFTKLHCEACNVNIKDVYKYKEHLKSEKHKVSYRRSHRCKHCGFGSYSIERLRKHNTKVHSKDHKCDLCSFTSKIKQSLAIHRLKVHFTKKKDKNGSYNCDECAFSTVNKTKFLYHLNVGHDPNVEKFRCDECTFISRSEQGFKLHKSTKHKLNENADRVINNKDVKMETVPPTTTVPPTGAPTITQHPPQTVPQQESRSST